MTRLLLGPSGVAGEADFGSLCAQVAVVIKVEETTGRRRQLRLDLASWDDLPESEICGRLVGLNLKEQAET